MERKSVDGREVLIEFRQIGDSVKVTAIDPDSLTEISMVGSSKVSQHELSRLAVRKLDFVMNRDKAAAPVKPSEDSGGGILA
jgi:hypothetical protein